MSAELRSCAIDKGPDLNATVQGNIEDEDGAIFTQACVRVANPLKLSHSVLVREMREQWLLP